MFRAGQADTASPAFAAQYDELWLEYYVLGRACGGEPKTNVTPAPTGIKNFSCTVLTNPYTQDLENPAGKVDLEWVKKMCGLALGCMAALVATVCKRGRDWKRMVVDIPTPIRDALKYFPDFQTR